MANKAKMKHLLNPKLKDIQEKRIGVNAKTKHDINKEQLNLTKPVSPRKLSVGPYICSINGVE
jgi:hypothetical protein